MKRTFFSRTKRLLVVPAAALGIVLTGCGGGESVNVSSHSNEHRLVGTWVEEGSGKTLTLNADGSCSVVTGTEQDAKTAQGQWGIAGNEIVTTLPPHLISGRVILSYDSKRYMGTGDIQGLLGHMRKYFLSPDGKTLIIIKEETHGPHGVFSTYATYKKKEK
ncbi:hypothetical protein FACS1894199_13410 [Bacteroidia bacterium]|nr:hypothetical protein FACS1894199_13410 [Bacteroidia bacterium]